MDTRPAPAQIARPVSLFQIAPSLPARVIRLPPPSMSISPAAPAKRRQIRPSGMAEIGHVLRIPRHTDCQTWHARRASRPNLSALVIRQQIRDTSVSASIESRWWW